MKSVFVLSVLVLSLLSSTACSLTKLNLKNLPKIEDNRILTDTSGTDGGNMTEYYDPDNKSSGISTGGIVAIAVPCIAALVGVGAAAAILGASAPAAAPALAPVAAAAIPPPTFVDTSVAQLAVPQPQIVQPVVEPVVQPEIIPQPVQQVIQPIPKVETPIINIPQQPIIAQPQMVPVQQMQLVPVQQVEMVPVQQVEMVPVQQIVPTYQAAAEVVPQVTQVSGAQISQGIQGGEFLTAPEGYGTSAIQTTTNQLNAGEFSTNNLM
jgi:hypothetical protein